MTKKSTEQGAKPSSGRSGWVLWQSFEDFEVRGYVASFTVLLMLLLIVYFVGAVDKEDAFDFACFAFACLAGIIGGAALFYGSKASHLAKHADQSAHANPPIDGDRPDTTLSSDQSNGQSGETNRFKAKEKAGYGLSLLMLFVALLSYVLSHDTCQKLSIMIQAAIYVLVTASILIRRLLLDKSKSVIGFLVDASICLVIIAVICVIVGFPWNFGKAIDTTTWHCTDQTKHLL